LITRKVFKVGVPVLTICCIVSYVFVAIVFSGF
jgi:hypothetical protein